MIKINFEKDKAEAAVKSRDLIFSIISHDIRSPLIGLNYAIPAIKIAINNDNKEKKAQLLRGGFSCTLSLLASINIKIRSII